MIKVQNIYQNYGGLEVFKDFTMSFPEGKITAILGPSGCGKTTLLNILAGIVKVSSGAVTTVNDVSYLFQEPRLLPWLTVRKNILLVIEEKIGVKNANKQADNFLKATNLKEFKNFFPAQLSGGMRQRVAMARALSYPASLLLMDEPFKSLDLKTRFQLIEDFIRLWEEESSTVVMVTHDPKEAVMFGNQIVILSGNPAKIMKTIDLDLKQSERVGNTDLLLVEKEIYDCLTN